MAKEELLTIEGVVDEIFPDGRFGVLLDNIAGSSPTRPARCAGTASARSLGTEFTSR